MEFQMNINNKNRRKKCEENLTKIYKTSENLRKIYLVLTEFKEINESQMSENIRLISVQKHK